MHDVDNAMATFTVYVLFSIEKFVTKWDPRFVSISQSKASNSANQCTRQRTHRESVVSVNQSQTFFVDLCIRFILGLLLFYFFRREPTNVEISGVVTYIKHILKVRIHYIMRSDFI